MLLYTPLTTLPGLHLLQKDMKAPRLDQSATGSYPSAFNSGLKYTKAPETGTAYLH